MSTKVLATIRVEFLPPLVDDPIRRVIAVGPAAMGILVEIFVEEGRELVGWRLEWPAANGPLEGWVDATKRGNLFYNVYGAMTESTLLERIARTEYAVYSFLLGRGQRPRLWERVANVR